MKQLVTHTIQYRLVACLVGICLLFASASCHPHLSKQHNQIIDQQLTNARHEKDILFIPSAFCLWFW